MSHDAFPIRIATSPGPLGRVKNGTVKLGELNQRLADPARDNVTMSEFLALPKEEQNRRKNQGWYVGGYYAGKRRKGAALTARTLITLDGDGITPHQLLVLSLGGSALCQFEFTLYSTRKHTAEAPRVRIQSPGQG